MSSRRIAWGLVAAVAVFSGCCGAPLPPGIAALLGWGAGLWVSLLAFSESGSAPEAVRFCAALALGGLAAHLGWCALSLPRVVARPALLWAPAGFSGVFVPLGVFALAPRSEGRPSFLAAALPALLLGLALARLGCLLAGCCLGAPSSLPWAVAGRHPVRWLELLGLWGLARISASLPQEQRGPLALAGFGLLRLLLLPLRELAGGAPARLWVGMLDAAWLGAGLTWMFRSQLASPRPSRGASS